jgi:hypothetical protein
LRNLSANRLWQDIAVAVYDVLSLT